MANRTNLSSWGNLRDYLKTNVDPDKDWDNEDIKDYSALLGAQSAGKVSGDKFTEGRNLFQHYLADAQATDVYQQAQAKAENDARKESEYADFLTTRLASYLPQLQGNAGIKGYLGLTDGQSVALLNNQENTLRAIQGEKRTALQKALETYQGALASNSATAIDQATAIDAARDKKIADEKNIRDQKFAEEEDLVSSSLSKYLNGYETIDGYVPGVISEEGTISAKNAQKLKDYIEDANISEEAKSRLLRAFEFNYGDKIVGAVDENGNETLSQKQKDDIANSVKSTIDSTAVNKGNYEETMNLLDENKEVLGSDYEALVDKVNEQMDESTHKKGEGYEVNLTQMLVNGNKSSLSSYDFDFTVKVNGETFDVRAVKGVDKNTAKSLNASATGDSGKTPEGGTIVEKDGKLYVQYRKTLADNGWREIGNGKSKASDLLAAWNKYKKKEVSAPAISSDALNNYFAAATSNGADVKTAYLAGGSSRDILRNVKISAYGNKTFGEIMDAIDNSKDMTNTEKGRRRTSAYNQLANEVKKQNIKY